MALLSTVTPSWPRSPKRQPIETISLNHSRSSQAWFRSWQSTNCIKTLNETQNTDADKKTLLSGPQYFWIYQLKGKALLHPSSLQSNASIRTKNTYHILKCVRKRSRSVVYTANVSRTTVMTHNSKSLKTTHATTTRHSCTYNFRLRDKQNKHCFAHDQLHHVPLIGW